MGTGNVKIAEDQYSNKMQFGHVKMDTLSQVTTATVWDANSDKHVRMNPEGGDAYVYIGNSATTPTDGSDGFYLNGAEYFIVRAGEYIGSSSTLNCIELGENQ